MSFYPHTGGEKRGWIARRSLEISKFSWNLFFLHRYIDQRDGGDYHQTRCKVQLSLNIKSRNSCSSSRAHSALQDSLGAAPGPRPLHSMIFYATKSRTADEKKRKNCACWKSRFGEGTRRIRREEIFFSCKQVKAKRKKVETFRNRWISIATLRDCRTGMARVV